MLQIKRRNTDGTLSEFVPVSKGETPEQKMERLEAENEALKEAQAELTFQLMIKGVL